MRMKENATLKQISKSHKRKQAWQRFVRTMAMIVVFCTTYALILPAITLQTDTICGLESHIHTESCYEARTVTTLSCTQSESMDESHEHDESCETVEEISELICTKTEHTHMESCYPLEPESTLGLEFHCGFTAHAHTEVCYGEEEQLTCSISEHMHEAKCVVDQVDMTADMESEADWQRIADDLELTGNWAQDLLILAKSQMGYAESSRNCVLTGDQLRGYTRYGDWYGNPYLGWDDLFVAFCLNYAGIPEESIPWNSDTDSWIEQLEEMDLLNTADQSLPKAGDLVFCEDRNGQRYAAVVEDVEVANSNLDTLSYRVIAGDVNNQVDTLVVSVNKIQAICDLNLAQAREGDALVSIEVNVPEETTGQPEEETVSVYVAESENYMVTVTCGSDVVLPQGAELRVTEYSKNSEVYARRCQEAGYELEWLLNIGFYLGESELKLSGDFDVVVTSKQGKALGQDITHFASSGTERISGNLEEDQEQNSVSFQSDGFSDFGGGIATAAVTDGYRFTTVDPSQLQTGVNYVLYVIKNNNIIFLSTNGTETAAITTQTVSGANNIGSSWSLTNGQMGNTNSANYTWQISKNRNNTYLVCQNNEKRLALMNGWASLSDNGSALNLSKNGNGATVGTNADGRSYHLRYEDGWRASWYNDQGVLSTQADVIYFARITTETTPDPAGNYPHAVHTGEVHINRLRFYNLCENGENGVTALAGCVFEITGTNGYTATVVSGKDPEVDLPAGIPDGTYTITEISVPEGYLRDTEYARTFVIKNGALASDNTIGTFINHNIEQLVTDKTAEVEDYANRIYQINITAESKMRLYEMEPIDVLFVVDQSNSMLFPAVLQPTGKEVTLTLSGSGNDNNMNALNLDKSKMHYIIADPTGTSTVWAVWHDGTAWMCQDASYYAKAKHSNEEGYQDDNETVIFPSNLSYADQKASEASGVRSNGGALGKNLTGSSLGTYIDSANGDSRRFVVYTTDDEYNRLHYLEEALANIIYQLADVNDENRVSLTRFTKVINNCYGPYDLTPANADYLVDQVISIKTSGGTRQDIALEHVYTEHLSNTGEHFDKGVDHTYTLLVTDGAPVGTSSEPVGNPGDPATTRGFDSNGVSIYGRIKGWAAQVRTKSTLMAVGLGMENVEGGKEVLQEIASNDDFYCAMEDAEELLVFVQKLLFESFRAREKINLTGDIVDEISDSFYPIAWVPRGSGTATDNRVLLSDNTRDWVLLEEGDWLTLDGKLATAGAADAAGQLLRKADGTFYVQWLNQNISDSEWEGIVYVKAKEDFIGGNAIDTNKDASVTSQSNEQTVVKSLETPTVNVRLLDMNQMDSMVTVYLGQQVNGEGDAPLDSLKYFYENTKFAKLIADGGDILNKVEVTSDNGLKETAFFLLYAMGQDLTQEQLDTLKNGDPVMIPYTYDDASNHGAVGYFTFRLEKSGLGSSYDQHEAIDDCQPGGTPSSEDCTAPAETYTLNITYTAYRLGQNGRPATNVHNGSDGPGTEVGRGDTLEKGKGTVEKKNTHKVHVISGAIEIMKYFESGITDPEDRTFTFTLHREEDEDHTLDVTKTITIPANQTEGSAPILFDGLRWGTYTVVEAADEDYAVKSIEVLENTNCYSRPGIGGSATELVFVMEQNVAGQNVIGRYNDSNRYTSYIDPGYGVYGAGAFTNAPVTYTAEIPVEKIWDDGAENHTEDMVYVVLYLNDSPVLDADGNARLLQLDAASDWKGIFKIALTDENDSLENYRYSIREVSQTKVDEVPGWQSAILENNSETILYYEKALEAGQLFHIHNRGYMVEYGTETDGRLTVTNSRSVDLPQTGGMGTHMYTIGGMLLMIAAALMLGCSQRRKTGRRASD